jgi:3-dehydroquinate synthetase
VITLRCAPADVASTEVVVGIDAARDLDGLLARVQRGVRFAVLDACLERLHGERVRALAPRTSIEGGEDGKSFAALERVLRTFARAALSRDTLLVIAGGGSVGDLGGLAAALYARGLDHALLPTTLLAMVDSSIGGKTAIDLPEGKNLVGAFHPPRLVAIDLGFLPTLPEVEFRSGLGELLKVAIGLSAELFALLETHAAAVLARDPAVLVRCVQLALAAKIAVVETDFHERGPRRLLNLGHTLGHALEAHSGYRLRHGIAVARGLHFALDVARRGGHLRADEHARCQELLARYGFAPTSLPDVAALRVFLRRDKKSHANGVAFIVPTGVGAAAIVHKAWADLEAALG